MTAAERAWVGRRVVSTLDDRQDNRVTATLTIDHATKLGCGCTRLEADRPGTGEDFTRVQLLTGCGAHASYRDTAAHQRAA